VSGEYKGMEKEIENLKEGRNLIYVQQDYGIAFRYFRSYKSRKETEEPARKKYLE
jgi:hypothetical protein